MALRFKRYENDKMKHIFMVWGQAGIFGMEWCLEDKNDDATLMQSTEQNFEGVNSGAEACLYSFLFVTVCIKGNKF